MKKHLLLLALSVMSFGVVRAQDGAKIEAEDAAYENCELVEGTQYSGGKALAMKESNGKITFKYNASEGGKFTVYVGYDCPKGWGAKVFDVSVNGNKSKICRRHLHAERDTRRRMPDSPNPYGTVPTNRTGHRSAWRQEHRGMSGCSACRESTRVPQENQNLILKQESIRNPGW